MTKQILDDIIDFIYKERWKYKKQLTYETTLEKDLKITGDDAFDFMEAFFKKFKVDCSSFDINKFFTAEGFDPLGINSLLRKVKGNKVAPKKTKDLTIRDLETSVKLGKWVEP